MELQHGPLLPTREAHRTLPLDYRVNLKFLYR